MACIMLLTVTKGMGGGGGSWAPQDPAVAMPLYRCSVAEKGEKKKIFT